MSCVGLLACGYVIFWVCQNESPVPVAVLGRHVGSVAIKNVWVHQFVHMPVSGLLASFLVCHLYMLVLWLFWFGRYCISQ